MSDTIVTKQCFTCKEIKGLSKFHKQSSAKDGLQSNCKDCTKKYHRSDKYNTVKRKHYGSQKYKDTQQKYRKTQVWRRTQNKASSIYRKNNPVKIKARCKINNAVESGRIQKVSTYRCRGSLDCFNQAANYHHWSYAKEHWFDVIPLCKMCHTKIHWSY